jgi:hypothetical protein
MYLLLCNYPYIEGLATQYALHRFGTFGLTYLLPVVNIIEITNMMRPCGRIYYSNVS